jgi:hypothetical protein
MIDSMNVPEDWGIANKDSWVADKPFDGKAKLPALEGRYVVEFCESASFAAGQFIPDNIKEMAAGQPNYTFRNPQTGQTYLKRNGRWTVSNQDGKEVQKRMSNAVDRGNIPKEHIDEPKPKSETRPRPKPKQETQPKLKPESEPKSKERPEPSREATQSSTTLNQANSQREAFLKERGRDPNMYIDTQMVGRGKERTTIRSYVERELNDNPKLKDATIDVLEFMSLWVDGDGKRISGDTVKEGKTAQDVKQFSLEYKLNSDGSVSQTDLSEEGEQRAFRNYGELESILNGPIKKSLLAAGLTEEDLSEHPPQKPNLKGLSKEQKDAVKAQYEKQLSDYKQREAKRNSIAENLSQEDVQKHLQVTERQNFGSPLDTFKKLSPEEQDRVTDLVYKLLPVTLKQRFDKVGSPRKNIFGGYEIQDGKKIPIYADKITSTRGRGMLKKYLMQGGIDGYTQDRTIMGPFALTLDHVLPSAKGGGDHPDNGVFTRGGLNTHLRDNNFLWLYRSALGEKERLNQLSENPEEQKRLYNEAQSAAYKSQFGASVALSQAGVGKKLSESALNNSRGSLTGDMQKDIGMVSKNIFDNDLREANATSLDPSSTEVQEFVKKQAFKILGISYFGTSHPNAPAPSEKRMSSSMQNLLWGGVSSKLKEGQSFDEINDAVGDIKSTLAAAMLSGTQAGNRYLLKTDAGSNQNSEDLFRIGIGKLSKFMGRGISTEEINMIRSQF